MAEEKKKMSKEQKAKIWRTVLIVVLVVLAWIAGYFWAKNTISPIEKNIEKVEEYTKDWKIFRSEKYGFSFKHPKDMEILDLTAPNAPKMDPITMYVVSRKDSDDFNKIKISVNTSRKMNHEDAENSLQVSMPFDKKNYLIFSTATSNDNLKEFYNILATLELGVK